VFLHFYWTALTDPQDTSAAVTQSSPTDVSAQIRKPVIQGGPDIIQPVNSEICYTGMEITITNNTDLPNRP
jgi:hypothetical protein